MPWTEAARIAAEIQKQMSDRNIEVQQQFYDINTKEYKYLTKPVKHSTECKWCGAPKSTVCCEYCRRD